MSIKSFTEKKAFQSFNTDIPSGMPISDILVYSRHVNGANTPNFRRIKKRNLPYNNVTMTVSHVPPNQSIGYEFRKNGSILSTQRYHIYGSGSTADVSSELLTRSDKAAGSRILQGLSNMDVNLAQAFGERSQVVNMLASTARRLTSSYRSLRQGRLEDCVNNLGLSVKYVKGRSGKAVNSYYQNFPKHPERAASSFWLEIQYGWRPLLSDVYGTAKMLAEKHVSEESDSFYCPQILRRTSTLSDDYSTRTIRTYDSSVRSVDQQVRTIKHIQYAVTNPALRYTSMCGLTNPALLAWELTPFSFVVDWFLPIGKYLQNISSTYGLTFMSGGTSVRAIAIKEGHSIFDTTALQSYPKVFQLGIQPRSVKVNYSRTSMSAFPLNPLPEFKNPVSITHAANAIALLVQVFGRKT